MTCYHPIQAYQCWDGSVVFTELRRHDARRTLLLACGQCGGCRLNRSRQWAVRCLNEAQMHEENCFITLTYKDAPMSLDYSVFQAFMRRLRKYVMRTHRLKVRFFMSGEYGTNPLNGGPYGRPHYHACLFGYDFPDRVYHAKSDSGFKIYRSDILAKLWPHGFSSVGDVSFESAAYVARYILKKLTGDGEDTYYNIFDPSSGEIWTRAKEFCHMSLKPGIGSTWLSKFSSDVYPDGQMVVNGSKVNPPKYYDRWLKREDELAWEDLAYRREIEALTRAEDSTAARLLVREQVENARVSFLKRKL